MDYTTLDKICENLDYLRKPITGADRISGNVPYYGASGIVDYVHEHIFDEKLLLVSEDGANLLARSTPIAFSIEGKAWVNNHAHVLRFKDEILQKCVELYLNSISLEAYITGTAQPKLNQKMLNEIPIPIIDGEIMESIVKTIARLEKVIDKRKVELEEFDNLIKSRFVEMFGDPITNSHKLFTEPMDKRYFLKAGITTSADDIHEYIENEYEIPCYGGNGVRGFVEQASYEGEYPIIGRQGALCGNVQYAMRRFHATEHAVLVSMLKNDNPIWTFYMLKLMDLHRYHTGAAQPGLAVKTLNTVAVIVTEREQQDEFAEFVEQVNKLKFEIQKSLDKTQTLMDSLMQQYFG